MNFLCHDISSYHMSERMVNMHFFFENKSEVVNISVDIPCVINMEPQNCPDSHTNSGRACKDRLYC